MYIKRERLGKLGSEEVISSLHLIQLGKGVGDNRELYRVVPDIRLAGYPTFFISGIPVSFAGYPAGRITG